jgi:hypothetical protein
MNATKSVLVLLLLLVACSSTSAAPDLAPGETDGRPCTTSADCGGAFACGYEIALRCDAKGFCFKPTQTSCAEIAIYVGQDCGGGPVNVNGCNDGLPAAYAPRPLSCHLPDSRNRPNEIPCK